LALVQVLVSSAGQFGRLSLSKAQPRSFYGVKREMVCTQVTYSQIGACARLLRLE